MTQILRQSTSRVIGIGPFMDTSDAITPESGITLTGADETFLRKHDTSTAVDLSGRTWAAIPSMLGHYALTLTSADTDTVGALDVCIQDSSIALPVIKTFQVVEEAIYDALFAGSAAGFNASGFVILADGSLTSAKYANNAITSDVISANAVTKIQASQVTSAQVFARTITSADYVTSAEFEARTLLTSAYPTSAQVFAQTIASAQYVTSAEFEARTLTSGTYATSAQVDGLNDVSTAEVSTAATSALTAIHLDHLLAADYDPASPPGSATAYFNEIAESNGGVTRFTAGALAQAPGGGDGSGFTAIPWNAAWDAEVESEVTDALNAYDPPTSAEMDARTITSAQYVTSAEFEARTQLASAYVTSTQVFAQTLATSAYVTSTQVFAQTLPTASYATSAQVAGIGAAAGGSTNHEATTDNTGGAIKGVSFVGSQTGTFSNTEAEDGSYHQIDHTGNDIDIIYGFDIGGSKVATGFSFKGYLDGANDAMFIQAYDFVGADWETRVALPGQALTDNLSLSVPLLSKHTGTGADLGLVYLRYEANGVMSAPVLHVDELLVEAVANSATIGYVGGAVWLDTNASNTNTESYVDGTTDNPVSTLAAARTIADNLNLKIIHCLPASAVTLTAASWDSFEFVGQAYSLALNGQSIDGLTVYNAVVTGVGEATTTQPTFVDCSIGAATIPPAKLKRCGIGNASGTFTAATDNGEFIFEDCYSEVPGNGVPTFDFTNSTASTGINNRRWSGGATYTLSANCTLTHEVVTGGGTTITTGGSDVEIRGICRSLTITLASAGTETVQFAGLTGPITINEAAADATGTVNLYGVSEVLTDNTTAGVTLNNQTVSRENINTEVDSALDTAIPGSPTADSINERVAAIDAVTGALTSAMAANLAESASGIVSAVVSGVTQTTSSFTTNLTEATDDHYIGRLVVFTTGDLSGQATDITDYNGTSKLLTVTTLTEAPSTGWKFVIL